MAYGVSKEKGGDNPENTARMESCVKKVMARDGVDKVSAIRICKESLFGEGVRKKAK